MDIYKKKQSITAMSFIAVVSGLIFPMIALYFFNIDSDFNIWNLWWIAFYSIVLLLIFVKSKLLKIILVIINIICWGMTGFGMLMGGFKGLLYFLVKTIIPFMPTSIFN